MALEVKRIVLEDNQQGSSAADAEMAAYARALQAHGATPDQFEGRTKQKKEKPLGVWGATKALAKGVFRPIITMVQNPVTSLLALGATAALTAVAPITVPLMVLGGLGFGSAQLFKGFKNAKEALANGETQAAEKALEDIGEGLGATLSSVAGIKTAGAIVAEAKATSAIRPMVAGNGQGSSASESIISTLNIGLDKAVEVQKGSRLNAFSEIGTLFTEKSGRQALIEQLHPKNLLAHGKAILKEAKRMVSEKPVVDLDAAVKTAQTRLGLADADMPNIQADLHVSTKLQDEPVNLHGIFPGTYSPSTHTLNVQPDGFAHIREGLRMPVMDKLPEPVKNFMGNLVNNSLDIEGLVIHEMTHAQQGLNVQKLTARQAAKYLKQKFPQMSSAQRKEILAQFNFTKQNNTLSVDEKHIALTDLKGFTEAFSGNQQRLFNTRPYLTAGVEIEARKAATNLNIDKAVIKLSKEDLPLVEKQQAIKLLRKALAEKRLNNVLGAQKDREDYPNLKIFDATSKKEYSDIELEQTLQATRKLFGAQNPTQKDLRLDAFQKRLYEGVIQDDTVNRSQFFANLTAEAFLPSEGTGSLFRQTATRNIGREETEDA